MFKSLLITISLLLNSCMSIPAPASYLQGNEDVTSNLERRDGPYQSVIDGVLNTNPGTTLTTLSQAFTSINTIFGAGLSTLSLPGTASSLISNGLAIDLTTFNNLLLLTGENSISNNNTISPPITIFPKKSSSDAPYSLTESQLRAAIYIPPTFTYGTKQPVVLVPGTGSTGYESYIGSFIPLLRNTSYADPVWLNIPGNLMGDVQTNAEYVAYALNYIAGITSRQVSVIAWSQGNLDTQWAYKYWPSTRTSVRNQIAISPDYQGTVEAFLLCPGGLFNLIGCAPSIYQQRSLSDFLVTLRRNGGDSAYVPTTVVYSVTDEIVQPQVGLGTSSYLGDARGVGVSINLVQNVCSGEAAGGLYTHEGVLYNPLAGALAVDAIVNGGTGSVNRIDLTTVCQELVTPGLDVSSVILTESTLLFAVVNTLGYPSRVLFEPAIKSYATY